jgi:hypothetical protein
VKPFGGTIPDEPEMALIVWVPTVAIAINEVGVREGGIIAGLSDWLLENAGLASSVGSAGDKVSARTGVVGGRSADGEYLE